MSRLLKRSLMWTVAVLLVAAAVSLSTGTAVAQDNAAKAEAAPAIDKALKSEMKSSIDRGVRFLRQQQAENGRWQIQGHDDPGTTALALTAMFRSPRAYTVEDGPFVRRPMEYLLSLVKENGGIYDRGVANYVTCVAVMALEASGDESHEPVLEKARQFLVTLQSDEGEGYRPSDKFYGGAGYGGDERPDLSNMNFWIEGVRGGVSADSDPVKKALTFLNRCQNHSETNTKVWKDPRTNREYVSGNDGGAAYYPGNSPAGYDELESGQWVARSYGSMTYALLKCYLFAGLDSDDERVKAALGWISENFGFDENPGFDTEKDPTSAHQGLYYYYFTAAKALDMLGKETIVDGDGVPRRWREELARKLLSLQKEDGSWVNEVNGRWWEGEPLIATCYALLALELCYP